MTEKEVHSLVHRSAFDYRQGTRTRARYGRYHVIIPFGPLFRAYPPSSLSGTSTP
ncbi:hypothetical protein MY4824_004077 [Beauveria thailandica]